MTIYSFCIISRLNALEKKNLFEVAFEFSSTFHCWKAMEKNSNVARGKNSDIALEKNSNVTLEFSDGRTHPPTQTLTSMCIYRFAKCQEHFLRLAEIVRTCDYLLDTRVLGSRTYKYIQLMLLENLIHRLDKI